MKPTLRSILCSWSLAVVSALVAAPAGAYDEIAVQDGGTVTGTVQFEGEVPEPARFELRRSPDRGYCGALSDGSGYRFLREVAVGPGRGLKDVVITIDGVEKGKAFDLVETKLEANICQFVPFVSVMRDRHMLSVTNIDSVAHDLQIYERDQDHIFIMFHRPALTKAGTRDLIRMTGGRRAVIMQCGMHPYMQGHGVAVDNPYYAVTNLDGTFTISDLPPGSYRLRAWHPTLGEQVRDITVAAKGTVQAELAFKER